MISKRALHLKEAPSAIMTGYIKCLESPYCAETNPKGYLNFGIAENHLSTDLLLKKINEPVTVDSSHIQYNCAYGREELRVAFKMFLEEYLFTGPINSENLIIQTGLSSICESLSFSMFDQGDYLLIPTPYYTGFEHDFTKRFGVNLLKAHLEAEKNFKHDIEVIKKTYLESKHRDKTKALLITHPNNPTGERLSLKFMHEITDFAKEYNLEIITDEIYALSTHCHERHTSLFKLATEKGVAAHLLYGMAKDFSLAGLKVGVLYSNQKDLTQVMQDVSYFHPVSSHTQELVTQLLNDHFFLKQYIQLNQERLNKTKRRILTELNQLNFLDNEAGLFIMLDLSNDCKTFEKETQIHEKLLNQYKINITKGADMGMQAPGYFRLCFAHTESEISELCKRLKEFK